MLEIQGDKYGLTLKCRHPDDRLEELIIGLHKKLSERVVVLVDEYDKPILSRRNVYAQRKRNP